jgi:DNA-directed RNA polymerase subunit omega
MADLVDKVGSRYMLVNVVAHRARQLAIKEEDPELATGKKPVSEAIDEVFTGKLTIEK